MINTKLLRGSIYKVYKSQTEFSKDVGWSKNKIGRILNGTSIPSINDCNVLLSKLFLSDEEYKNIFLPSASPNGDYFTDAAATANKDSESNQL